MPSKSKRRVTDDDSDAGTDHGTERQKKPKLKHTKGEGLAQRSAADDVPGDGARDDDGAAYWEISKNRRVTVSDYNGKTMVHVREYYSKDEKMLPGKKGISLPIDQFSALISTLPYIEVILRDKGVALPRPQYSDEEGKDKDRNDERKGLVGAGKDDKVIDVNGPDKKNNKKRNFEATSDEEGSETDQAKAKDDQ